MNKKEIVHNLEMIYSVFDDLNNPRTGCKVRDYGEIQSFVFGLLDHSKRVKAILGEDSDEKNEELLPLELELFESGFGFGYAVGQLFSTPYPQIKKAVKSIQTILKEQALLPYFPKEKEKRTS